MPVRRARSVAACWKCRLMAVWFLAVFLALPAELIFASGQPPIFSAPLHLTREVTDPISGRIDVIEEYCVGNRMVSVARKGERVSIADYGKSELTEVDRAAGTYSVTSFRTLAAAFSSSSKTSTSNGQRTAAPPWKLVPSSPRSIAGRQADVFEGDNPEAKEHVVVALDREVKISFAAVQVLTGGSYPASPNTTSDVVLAAASMRSGGEVSASNIGTETSGLPLEQTVIYRLDKETLEFRNRVVRVGSEMVPEEFVTIPVGSRLIESKLVKGASALHDLDSLPPAALKP